MENAPHLIVLRGNAASGKSTVAAALHRALGPGTANIGQDHFRRVILREHDVPDGDNIGLIAHTARYCAGIGNHVIVEDILVAKHYRTMLRELVTLHRGQTHVFYLDVPLDRRCADMRLLDGTADLAVTLDVILDTVGAVTTERAGRGRYL